MPELPEVETIKRVLEPQLAGHKIFGADIIQRQIIAWPSPEVFVEILLGRTVTGLSRRGKFLSLLFDNGDSLTVHLRMSGQLLVTPPDFPLEKHTHLILHFEDDRQLRYIDVRRFGRFWYLKKDEEDITGRQKLGPEPFDPQISPQYFQEKLGQSRKTIKEILLDQTIVAGIGNIYADETLFAAKIHPARRCQDLTPAEWKRLAEQIPYILQWGIDTNATTPEEWLAGKGKEYRNTPELRVYGHAGKPCPVCGACFQRITVGGRGTCFCPSCQKKPGSRKMDT